MPHPKKIKAKDQYEPNETQRRFEAALLGAFSTPPKPMKEIPRKRLKQRRKPRTKASV
jgi:hypothetical protein